MEVAQTLRQWQSELDIITVSINDINQLISTRSFTTAANVLSDTMDLEDAAHQKLKNSNTFQNIRKIFSSDNEILLVDLKYHQNSIDIRFSNSEITKVRQEHYINYFVKPTLVSLKKIEHDLTPSIAKSFYGENEYIDRITLQNVINFESFEFIVEKMEDFLKIIDVKKE